MSEQTIHSELQALSPGRQISAVDVRTSPYRTSHRLLEVDVAYADGSDEQLILKDLGVSSLSDDALRARPPFLVEPLREIEVYRDVLEPAALGTAAYRGSVVRPDAGRFWLFLERLPGVELYQVGDLGVWCSVAARLAELHTRLADATTEHLVQWDRIWAVTWLERAVRFSGHPSLGRLERELDRLVDRLAATPQGLFHGELYASNVIVEPGTGRVSPIDWETAAIGPQLVDLAALTAGGWTEQERHAIALAYLAASGSGRREDEFLVDLGVCRLYLTVQRLGWAEDWTPPAAHAYDWARELEALGAVLNPS
jgi:phosphotransferase family enzyme